MVIKQNNKDSYKYQSYLDKAKNIEHRISITRLRCLAHILKEITVYTIKSISISEHARNALAKKLRFETFLDKLLHLCNRLGDLKESPSLGESSHVMFSRMTKYSSLTAF